MKNINIRRTVYHIRNNYLTMNNLVVLVAFLIAASWAWGSIGVVQKNYILQGAVDDKKRQAKLVELETQNLIFEQKYFQSAEYQELAVRERTGLALPGEKVLVLPPNSAEAKAADLPESSSSQGLSKGSEPSNLQQWANFLFGGSYSASS